MERELPLMEGDTLRGHILCRDEGCYMTFLIDAPLWDSGVKKVWLCSEGGGRLLLGTLLPEQHRLRLRRRLSHSALRCCGVAVPSSGQVNPRDEMDSWNSIGSLQISDPVISAGLSSVAQGGWRRENGQLELRFPWCVGQAVPLVSLFCLASARDGWWCVSVNETA